MRRPLAAGALTVLAPRPAAGPALAFLQLLLRPANAARSGHLLLGILDPADELVASQGRDVLPGIECRDVGDQRRAQVCGQLVDHSTGHSLAAHRAMVEGRMRASLAIDLRASAPRLGASPRLCGSSSPDRQRTPRCCSAHSLGRRSSVGVTDHATLIAVDSGRGAESRRNWRRG